MLNYRAKQGSAKAPRRGALIFVPEPAVRAVGNKGFKTASCVAAGTECG